VSAPATRTLQPAAWRRSVGPIVVAVILLSVVLQEPVSALFPADAPRWLVFLAIAVPVVSASVLGLSAAYPRVRVDADGALRVRGRRVPPADIVSVRRSVSSGSGASYLVYALGTSAGRRVRVLVAGVPMRGLDLDQLAVLRAVIAASGIRAASDSEQLERAFLSQNVLASGARIEVDRGLVLRELDGLRGVPHRADTVNAVADASASTEVAPAVPVAGLGRAAQEADDRATEQRLASEAPRTRRLRRVALALFALACLVAAVLLVVLVILEATGTDFGAADDDPLTATMLVAMVAALVTGILWAIAADADDARRRVLSQRWLAEATAEQRARGLPSPFHAAWLRAPGGRMTGFALLLLAMVAMLTVIGGPVALVQNVVPPIVGIVVTVAGAALCALALWAWFARRRAHARRVEWLVGVAGARAEGGGAFDEPLE
jgi:hypothetical protein